MRSRNRSVRLDIRADGGFRDRSPPARRLPRRQVGELRGAGDGEPRVEKLAEALRRDELLRPSQQLLAEGGVEVVDEVAGALGRRKVEPAASAVAPRREPPGTRVLGDSMEEARQPACPRKARQRCRVVRQPGEPGVAQAASSAVAVRSSTLSSARTSRAARKTGSSCPAASRARGAPPRAGSSVHIQEAKVQPVAGRSGS